MALTETSARFPVFFHVVCCSLVPVVVVDIGVVHASLRRSFRYSLLARGPYKLQPGPGGDARLVASERLIAQWEMGKSGVVGAATGAATAVVVWLAGSFVSRPACFGSPPGDKRHTDTNTENGQNLAVVAASCVRGHGGNPGARAESRPRTARMSACLPVMSHQNC